MNSPDIISVSQYLDKINLKLKAEKAKILGEVSGLQMYEGRSYLYFSVKDGKDQSTIKCFMWKRDFVISGVTLREGMEVVVTAYPSVYKPNGGLALQVELVELVGEGALQLAYEELKKKLAAEGLFSAERKREIPEYPHRIGVITSKSGAVINDFLSNIGKFGFEILFVDSKVEGQDAIRDLLLAVETLKTKEIDVLVMMRGGGSLESFQAFNNEKLVRAVANFPAPTLTGIGHDKDAPLVSMISDRNVSTPTAVANLLNSSWNEALSKVRLSEEQILGQFQSALKDSQFLIENSEVTIQNRFQRFLETFRRAEETLFHSLIRIEEGIKRLKDFLTQTGRAIEAMSPERQLAQGYSIVRHDGKVVRSIKNIKKGAELDILVSDGSIASKVI